jgi:hypothetical protein
MATSKKSTGKKSKNQTSSQAATPANRSARQANAKARKTQDTSGHGYEQPLANYDPTTQSWKMCQVTSLWEEPKSLERLPKSGMTRNGVLYQQPDWVPIILEKESSSWPTPTASDHIERKSTQQTPNSRHSLNLPDAVKRWPTPTAAGDVSNAKGKFKNPTLGDAVRMWPTPTTQEIEHSDAIWNQHNRRVSSTGSTHSMNLADAVKRWPTPTVDDASNVNPKPNRFRGLVAAVNETVALWPTPRAALGDARNHKVWERSSDKPQNLENVVATREPSAVGGKLNPTWVEWLMGFPTGWTDLED